MFISNDVSISDNIKKNDVCSCITDIYIDKDNLYI